ncbi:MAG: hypothetical protein ACI9U2_004507 [Bradymonadia bacterium]
MASRDEMGRRGLGPRERPVCGVATNRQVRRLRRHTVGGKVIRTGQAITARLIFSAAAMLSALPGCFEVPPLPDSELECSSIDDCGDDETCIDGECASTKFVTFDISCEGLSQTFIIIACGERVASLECEDEGDESVIECPTNTRVGVCLLDRTRLRGHDTPDAVRAGYHAGDQTAGRMGLSAVTPEHQCESLRPSRFPTEHGGCRGHRVRQRPVGDG